MAHKQVEATSTAASPTEPDKADSSDHSEMAIYVGLPLIIAVFLAIVALLLLLVYFVLRSKNKQRYSKVPRRDKGLLKNLSNLPYPSIKPPSIKIQSVPEPDMTFTMAPQLPDPASTQRYPFLVGKHRGQKNRTINGDNKPKKANGKRNGRPPKDNGSRAVDSGTHSISPPKGAREREGSVISLSQFGEQHAIDNAFMLSAGDKEVPSSSDKLPELFLSLMYLKEKTILVVNVERVVGLPPRDDGEEVDAYVRLFFIPRLPEMAQRKTSKTRTAKHELDPVFHEEIQYEAMSEEELINSTLHVQVLDYRAYGRHTIICQSEVSLAHVSLGEEKESVILQLHPPRVRQ